MIRGAPCDVRAALQNGVRAVAVLWGCGSREELELAHPDATVCSVDELIEYLRRPARR
jgi:phosphoglycolate phosphatase-like HAD superfamily hydrolase